MSQALLDKIKQRFSDKIERAFIARDQMVTVELVPQHLMSLAVALYEEAEFDFKALIDVCGVDYSEYGQSEWRTHETTFSGFSRGKDKERKTSDKVRFASVYHLLSLQLNQRLRLRVFLDNENPKVPSVFRIWNAANWFEREAFDLFGIVFEGHPDLRRLLTDYGFVGHPFRKDFPLIGEVELRYDQAQERCVYEPVSIQPREVIPRVIRDDNRYLTDDAANKESEA